MGALTPITASNVRILEIPFKRPLELATGRLTVRRVAILSLTDGHGRTGFGEAAPLPGFSRESLGDAVAALRNVAPELSGQLPDASMDAAMFESMDDSWDSAMPPSAAFAIGAAQRDLISRHVDLGPGEQNAGLARAVQSVNTLLLPDEGPAEIEDRLRAGFRAIKVKVGRVSVEEDAQRVRSVAAAIAGRATVRVDANRSWSFEDARQFARLIRDVSVEYVEEPLADPSRLSEIAHHVPVAMDESVADLRPADLAACSWCTAVILKPTLLGSPARVTAYADAAREAGATSVISSAFETDVGLFALAALAARIGVDDVPAGLDTGRYLDGSTTDPPFEIVDGRILNPGHIQFEIK